MSSGSAEGKKMYKASINSREFVMSKKDIADRTDALDNPEYASKFYEAHKDTPLLDLVKSLSKFQEKPDENEDSIEVTKLLIKYKLGLNIETHYLVDRLSEEFQLIEKSIRELYEFKVQLKNHRHPLDKTYGEKPVW